MNWCSQHGECTATGDDGYCICEPGYIGEDCGTPLCPKVGECVMGRGPLPAVTSSGS